MKAVLTGLMTQSVTAQRLYFLVTLVGRVYTHEFGFTNIQTTA